MIDAAVVALARHLCDTNHCPAPCAVHRADAVAATAFLGEAGVVLPPGITIGAVWRVLHGGDDAGFLFEDQASAEHEARYGGQDGRPGQVEQAWRIRADGSDIRTAWRPA